MFSVVTYTLYLFYSYTLPTCTVLTYSIPFVGMLQANVSNEYNCLYGEPSTLCRKPDILLIKSGTM